MIKEWIVGRNSGALTGTMACGAALGMISSPHAWLPNEKGIGTISA